MEIKNISEILKLSKIQARQRIEQEKLMQEYRIFRKTKKSNYSVSFKEFLVKKHSTPEQIEQIRAKYESGYGLKKLAKELNITYSLTRQLFSYFKIPIRRGMNVITDELRKSRSEKTALEIQNKIGWFNEKVRSNLRIRNKTCRGVQGWYLNESMNKLVWLRSTYEYIYAKWLDRTHHVWDTEVTQYSLANGEKYRPDFFIYEMGQLTKVIEIKGYFDIRSNKASLLQQQLPVDVILLNFTNSSITPYIESGSNYLNELKEWKNIRKSNEN